MDRIVGLNRLAVEQSVDIVRKVRPEDLRRATPCAAWDLGALLVHMVEQHHGFAAASRGSHDLTDWTSDLTGPQALGQYAVAAEGVIEAFGADGAAEREFSLPEITTAQTFPGRTAIGFHFIDYVVHAWDVTRSIGVDYTLDPRLEEDALRIAFSVPVGPRREQPDSSFAPPLPETEGGSSLDRILEFLGRSPDWSPPA